MHNFIFDGRNSFSKTNTDAIFMHTKDAHIRNARLKSGYNVQIAVENAFGVIKGNHGFRMFLTRGKNDVKVEFTLLTLEYNINKLHNKIQQNWLGVSFYTKVIALILA